MAATERALGYDHRVARCHYCENWTRPTHVVPPSGMCGTGTERTISCASCAHTQSGNSIISYEYRDATTNDHIDYLIERDWTPRPKLTMGG